MKCLWLVNIEMPLISELLGNEKNNMGGWLDGMLDYLLESNKVIVVYPSSAEKNGNCGNLKFYSFNKKSNKVFFETIINRENPDVIHIWGTEQKHSLVMVNVLNQMNMIDRCVVSIQGLVSVIGKYHYYAFVPDYVKYRFTIRDIIKMDNIYFQKKIFEKNGENEKKLLSSVKHVIGRTDWDRCVVNLYNENAIYHKCNESLRDVFYSSRWEIDNCERRTVFLSQGSYPLKGFHIALEAIYYLKKKYPDIKLYITGRDVFDIPFYKISSYMLYIRQIIKKLNLRDNIFFCGNLNAEQMKERYMKCNVFVSPSSIENSPNSLGEAMLLGCPCIASDVGGVKSMLTDKKEGLLYPADEPYMLSLYIMKLFDDDNMAKYLSENAFKRAQTTHNRECNNITLIKIYDKLLNARK